MDFLLPWIEQHFQETNPFVFVQMMIIFIMVWRKLKPHLNMLEQRFEGIEKQLTEMKTAVTTGFSNTELRFKNIETRVDALEQPKELSHV